MNRDLSTSIISSHKACVSELQFKFDKKITLDESCISQTQEVDVNFKGDVNITNVNTTDLKLDESLPTTEESDSGLSKDKKAAEQTSESAGSTAWVTDPNTGTDADLRMADEEIDRIFTNATMNHTSLDPDENTEGVIAMLPSPPATVGHRGSKRPSVTDDSLDWEYKLPAPPTFRDEAKSPSVTEFGTLTIGNLSDVVCSLAVKQEKDNLSEPDVRKFSESYINNPVSVDEPYLKHDHKTQDPAVENKLFDLPIIKSDTSSDERVTTIPIELNNDIIKKENVEQNIINELSSALTHRPSKGEIYDADMKPGQELSSSSTLQNFTITTYKDTKPLEVFEDDSIKSSTGEKRDKSKDDAVFRAPKARVKEPNLSRTSSFSIENKLNGPMIKRSVSYVSLLAANMPRNSEPYRAHLRQHNRDTHEPWPRLRKTTSEVNIDDKGGPARESPLWQDETTQLQSVQVLRNILSRSQASLTSCIDEPDISHSYQRDPQTSAQKFEDTMDTNVESDKWGRSHSEETAEKLCAVQIKHSASLDHEEPKVLRHSSGPPSINLSTWNERQKRQIPITVKNDNDSISGFGKKNIAHDDAQAEPQMKHNSTASTPNPSNVKVGFQPTMKTEGFKPAWKSKSITDLSRIPIVRAVELKKPLTSQNYDRSSLKPVQLFDDERKFNFEVLENTINNKDDEGENFIGVNSLAKRFGVPQKRPTSMYVINNNNNYLDNDFKDIPQFSKNIVNDDNRAVLKTYGRSESSKNFEEAIRLQIKIKSEATSSDIKALSKLRSGGFIEDVPKFSTSKEYVNNKMPEKNTYLSRSAVNLFNNDLVNCSSAENDNINNMSTGTNHKQTVVSKTSIPTNPPQRVITSVFIGQTQTLDRNTRPVNLQPVVKGFRVSTEKSNKPKDFVPPTNTSCNVVPSIVPIRERDSSSSCSTEDVIPLNPWAVNLRRTPSQTKDCKTSSSTITIQDLPAHRTTYHRALSTPAFPYKDIAKDKMSAPATNTRANSLSEAPPPPPLPVLRPASERRGIKLLPPPAANPRDQLMASIRGFSQDNLKRVSK